MSKLSFKFKTKWPASWGPASQPSYGFFRFLIIMTYYIKSEHVCQSLFLKNARREKIKK